LESHVGTLNLIGGEGELQTEERVRTQKRMPFRHHNLLKVMPITQRIKATEGGGLQTGKKQTGRGELAQEGGPPNQNQANFIKNLKPRRTVCLEEGKEAHTTRHNKNTPAPKGK